MKRKKAVMIAELVEERAGDRNDNIAKDLMNWLREDAVSVPRFKNVEGVTIKEE